MSNKHKVRVAPAPAPEPLNPQVQDLEALLKTNPDARYQLQIIVLNRLLAEARTAEHLLRARLLQYEPEPNEPKEPAEGA